MIIECPSCLTKFSIDAQQLAGIEDPRFNCCRCGSYFELQQKEVQSAVDASDSPKAEESDLTQSAKQNVPEEESTPPPPRRQEEASAATASPSSSTPASAKAAAESHSGVQSQQYTASWSTVSVSRVAQSEEEDLEAFDWQGPSEEVQKEATNEPAADWQIADSSQFLAARTETPKPAAQSWQLGTRQADSSPTENKSSLSESAHLGSTQGGHFAPKTSSSANWHSTQNSHSGTWLVDETIAASSAASWLPDPNADLDELLVPKRKGEQLSLIDTADEESNAPAEGSPDSPTSAPARQTTEDLLSETHLEDDFLEHLVTAEWPDASTPKKAKRSLLGTRSPKTVSAAQRKDQRNTLSKAAGQTAAQSRQESLTKNLKETSTGTTSGSTSDTASETLSGKAARLASFTSSSLKKVVPQVMTEESREARKSKVAEVLAQAKAREELEEAQDAVERQKTTSSEDTVESKVERKARKRSSVQQKYFRDITFRKQTALGRIPSASIIQRAPIACIASVPVLLLLLTIFFATKVDSLPSVVQTVLRMDTESLPRLPPPGLGIVDLSSSIITLDSGHRALEIRGELLNATAERFSRVTILASLFNAENEKTQSLVVDPQNELQAAQVVALDAKAIEHLQSRELHEYKEIDPSARLSFRVVFPNFTGGDQWFSASVFSVERETA